MTQAASTFKQEARAIFKLALPVIGAMLAQMMLGTIDVVMAGRLGEDTLTAVGIGNSLAHPVELFLMGVLMSINPVVAHLHGAGKPEAIGSRFRQGLWLAAFVSLPGVLLVVYAGPVLDIMQIPQAMQPTITGYMRAWAWGMPPALLFLALRFFNEGLGITRPPLIIMIATIPLNIAANYILMYGKLGFPAMGAVGVGYATSAVWYFAFLCLAVWTLQHKGFAKYHLLSQTKPRWNHLKELIKIGTPNGISIGMEVSMFALVTLFLGRLGSLMVASHQVALNISGCTFMISMGLATATSIRIGHAAGAQSLTRVRTIAKAGVFLTIITSSIMMLFMVGFASPLAGLYTKEPDVQALAASLLMLAAVFQISDGIQVTVSGALRGLKDTRVPMLSNTMAYWLAGIPAGYYLGLKRGMGAAGFWWGLIIGLTVAAVLHGLRLHYLVKHGGEHLFEKI